MDAGLATAAAPTYFPPHRSGDATLVDGGVFVNNPTIAATIEAMKRQEGDLIHVDDSPRRLVGLGQYERAYRPRRRRGAGGALGWTPADAGGAAADPRDARRTVRRRAPLGPHPAQPPGWVSGARPGHRHGRRAALATACSFNRTEPLVVMAPRRQGTPTRSAAASPMSPVGLMSRELKSSRRSP